MKIAKHDENYEKHKQSSSATMKVINDEPTMMKVIEKDEKY